MRQATYNKLIESKIEEIKWQNYSFDLLWVADYGYYTSAYIHTEKYIPEK